MKIHLTDIEEKTWKFNNFGQTIPLDKDLNNIRVIEEAKHLPSSLEEEEDLYKYIKQLEKIEDIKIESSPDLENEDEYVQLQ